MTSAPLPFYLINAFITDSPHSGNQAAVVIFPLDDPRDNDDEYKLKVARDFGFAETAYLTPVNEARGEWTLRWFTPEVEVPLCGHATLAASRVIFDLHPKLDTIRFQTRFSGTLLAHRVNSSESLSNTTDISLSFPSFTHSELEQMVSSAGNTRDVEGPLLSSALGISPNQIKTISEFKFVRRSVLVELDHDVDLGVLKPDIKALLAICQGMIIITQAKPGLSAPRKLVIHSRCFAPGLGIDEDAVTGSAHSYLAAYYLNTPAEQDIPDAVLAGGDAQSLTIEAYQLSARGGKLVLRLLEEGGEMRVSLGGRAAEWGRGTLAVW